MQKHAVADSSQPARTHPTLPPRRAGGRRLYIFDPPAGVYGGAFSAFSPRPAAPARRFFGSGAPAALSGALRIHGLTRKPAMAGFSSLSLSFQEEI